MEEEVVIAITYRPALSFAQTAVHWRDGVRGMRSDEIAGEPALLAVLYSAMSIEALICEGLANLAGVSAAEDLLGDRVSVLDRWSKGAPLLSDGSTSSCAAVAAVTQHCKPTGPYGLLARSRNKLVHPRMHTEIIDSTGHAIRDGRLDSLVQDLTGPPTSLPSVRPAFPNMLKTPAAARWAVGTLAVMATLFHEARGVSIDIEWQDVLAKV